MKKNKYGAIKTVIDGISFDSKKEARRYMHLKILERAREISELELQPEFAFVYGGKVLFKYKPDFRYLENGVKMVEDVKGFKTPVYRLKKKLIEAQHGIKILET